MRIVETITALLLGAAIILAVAFVFLTASIPHAQAAACQSMRTSWYGYTGARTANGEYFDGTSLTAAHRSLPFGTKLRVTYRGKSVVVRINDRGPARWTKRDLDLSKAAARKLGMLSVGVATVCISRL